MKEKKKILFAGAYGTENAGDDLPLLVMCEKLKKIAPEIDFEFIVLTRHYNKWEEENYGVKFIKNLEYGLKEESEGKWFRGLNYGDDKNDLLRIKKEIKNSDLIILGAGHFFNDMTIDIFRGPIPLFVIYVFLSKLYHKKVMLFSGSASHFETNLGKEYSRWLLENSDAITLRDDLSRNLLLKLLDIKKEIHVLPDSTIGLEMNKKYGMKILKKENIDTHDKMIAVALRELNGILDKKISDKIFYAIAGTINELKREYKFVFIPQSTYKEDDDRLTAEKFVKLLDNDVNYHIIKNRYDPRHIVGLYSFFDITIAIRLHGAIFSSIAGTPFLAVNYLPKVEGFVNSIRMPDLMVEKNSSKENMLKLIHNILNDKTIKLKLEDNMKEKKDLANLYAEIAISLIK